MQPTEQAPTAYSDAEREAIGRRASIGAAAGTAVEYYDFMVYVYLAVVIAPLFFPSESELASMLAAMAVYGAGFVARPVGGLIFGRLGDRVGRRRVLVITVVVMGVATIATGLLPTYAAIGVAAPVLMTVLRLVQGFSAGGEIGGAASLVAESAPRRRRGLFGSATSIGIAVGMAAATSVIGLVSLVAGDAMATWGWRVPFLIALPLLVVCVVYRVRIEDSPVFQEMAASSEPAKAPVSEVLRQHKTPVFQIVVLGFGQMVAGGLTSVYLAVHLVQLGYPLTGSTWLIAGLSLVPVLLMPWAGSLSDRVGRRTVLALGFAGFVVLAVPCYWLMEQGNLVLALVAGVLLNLPYGMVQGVMYTVYAELLPTRVRYTGVSLGFNLAGVIGSGSYALVATWLIAATGITLSPSFYIIFASIVTLLTLWRMKETRGSEMSLAASGR